MGFIEKVCDSRGCVTHSGSVGVQDADCHHIKKTKVSDDMSDVAVYGDLADALSSNGIKYSLDDFRIWTKDIIIDESNGRYTLTLFADGFVEDEDTEFNNFNAYYDAFGKDSFYSDTILQNWGIYILHDDKLIVEVYGTGLNAGQAKSLADLLGFISEEVHSYETAVNEIKKALSSAGIAHSFHTEGNAGANANSPMERDIAPVDDFNVGEDYELRKDSNTIKMVRVVEALGRNKYIIEVK